jgi:hypothetical protein
MGVFNLFFTFIVLFAMISFLVDNNASTALAVGLASLSLIIVSLILSIPLLIFIKKKGYKNDKFYVFTHISLFFSSLIALLASLLLS